MTAADPQAAQEGAFERLGIRPTPAPGKRSGPDLPWDESTRPHWDGAPAGAVYSGRGRAAARHLIDVHDHLRGELARVRDLIEQVRSGAIGAAEARSAINQMAMRQNTWTLGAYCASYCRIVTGHHTLEDEAIFPHLRAREPGIAPVIDRLAQEHGVIHKVLDDFDRALAESLRQPGEFASVLRAADVLADALLSHLAYEESQLIEPLARLGFYPGQV